jgi:hypothetical protein
MNGLHKAETNLGRKFFGIILNNSDNGSQRCHYSVEGLGQVLLMINKEREVGEEEGEGEEGQRGGREGEEKGEEGER